MAFRTQRQTGFRVAGALATITLAPLCVHGQDPPPAPPRPSFLNQPPEPLQRNRLRSRALGCYRIHPGGEGVPAAIRLDTSAVWTLAPPSGTARRVVILAVTGRPLVPQPRKYQVPRWSADSLTDSVRIALYTGFGGVGLSVLIPASPAAAAVLGQAVRSHDFGPPFDDPPTRVTLRRIRCPR